MRALSLDISEESKFDLVSHLHTGLAGTLHADYDDIRDSSKGLFKLVGPDVSFVHAYMSDSLKSGLEFVQDKRSPRDFQRCFR